VVRVMGQVIVVPRGMIAFVVWLTVSPRSMIETAKLMLMGALSLQTLASSWSME
jgi:hypothetical protein